MNGLKKLWKMKAFIMTIMMLQITPTLAWSAQLPSKEELSPPQTEKQGPDGEFLEFLGLFDDADAGWVDPMYLLESDDDFTHHQKEKEGKDETR